MVKKIYVTLILLIVISTSGLGYYFYNQKQTEKQSIADSNQYFETMFKIQSIENLGKISIDQIQTLQSTGYKTLAEIVTINHNFMNKKSALNPSLIKTNIENKKNDKLLRDLITLYYGKVLLNQSNFELFEKYILPEISKNSFTYEGNAAELIIVYNKMNKKQSSIPNTVDNLTDLPNSLKTRLQILDRETKFLLKK